MGWWDLRVRERGRDAVAELHRGQGVHAGLHERRRLVQLLVPGDLDGRREDELRESFPRPRHLLRTAASGSRGVPAREVLEERPLAVLHEAVEVVAPVDRRARDRRGGLRRGAEQDADADLGKQQLERVSVTRAPSSALQNDQNSLKHTSRHVNS